MKLKSSPDVIFTEISSSSSFKVIANIDKDKSNLVTNWIQSSNSFTGEVLQINTFDTDKLCSKDKLNSEECFNLFYRILNYYKQWI